MLSLFKLLHEQKSLASTIIECFLLGVGSLMPPQRPTPTPLNPKLFRLHRIDSYNDSIQPVEGTLTRLPKKMKNFLFEELLIL